MKNDVDPCATNLVITAFCQMRYEVKTFSFPGRSMLSNAWLVKCELTIIGGLCRIQKKRQPKHLPKNGEDRTLETFPFEYFRV